MKKISIFQRRLWLVWGVFLSYCGLQISCTPENSFDRNVQVILQIPLPDDGGLKNATLIAGVRSVTLTVTGGNEVPLIKELTISGNKAIGTLSILPGKSRKFTADARDENNIIQWQGSTTIDIDDHFTVSIQLTPVLPTANILKALEKDRSVNLSWNQNSDPDFASYQLYRSQSGNIKGTLLDSTTVNTETEFMDNLAIEGNSYFYTLVVTDTEGFRTESTVNINPNYPPTASVLYGSEDGYVYLNWTLNYDSDFAGYNLYRSQLENVLGTLIYSTNVIRNYVDSKVSEGNTYFYTLEVTDTKGLNTKSNVVRINIPVIPPTESFLKVDSVSYYHNAQYYVARLSWTQNYDSDFSRYELYLSTSNIELGKLIDSKSDAAKLVYWDSNLYEGITYYYTLFVYDRYGSRTKSKVVQLLIGSA